MFYRARSGHTESGWLVYPRGENAGKPIECKSMKALASNVAACYDKHPMVVMTSKYGRKYGVGRKRDQLNFSKLVEEAFSKGSEPTKEAEKSRVVVAYRAKSCDTGNWITHTYGTMYGEPIEGSTMKDLAYSIAYLYHRHPVELYASYDGKKFTKASGALAKTFDKIMDDEFRYDEWRH